MDIIIIRVPKKKSRIFCHRISPLGRTSLHNPLARITTVAQRKSTKTGSRVIHPRLTGTHGDIQDSIARSRERPAGQELGDLCPTVVARCETERVAGTAAAEVGEDGDHFAFAHGNGGVVGVEGVVLIGEVGRVVVCGVLACRVEGLGCNVKFAVGGVA